jgi:hypothetical protein
MMLLPLMTPWHWLKVAFTSAAIPKRNLDLIRDGPLKAEQDHSGDGNPIQ